MTPKKIITSLTLATLLAVGGLASKANAEVKTNAPEIPVYRLYNTHSGEHFYSTSDFEKNSLVNSGWNYEGTGWQAPTKGQAVYRLYNPNAKGGDHYYTQSNYEAKSLVQKGWKWDNKEQPVFYSGGDINNYVAYNPNAQSGAHNYTTSVFEQNSLLNEGWKYGKVAWKVQAPGQSVTPMNLSQMLKGDYSSIQGTWKNSLGNTLTFNGNKVTGDVDVTAEGVKEATLNNGVSMHNVVWASSTPKTRVDLRYFIFASKNTSPNDYPDNTDKTRDRLFITTNGGNAMFNEAPEYAFYRTK